MFHLLETLLTIKKLSHLTEKSFNQNRILDFRYTQIIIQ